MSEVRDAKETIRNRVIFWRGAVPGERSLAAWAAIEDAITALDNAAYDRAYEKAREEIRAEAEQALQWAGEIAVERDEERQRTTVMTLANDDKRQELRRLKQALADQQNDATDWHQSWAYAAKEIERLEAELADARKPRPFCCVKCVSCGRTISGKSCVRAVHYSAYVHGSCARCFPDCCAQLGDREEDPEIEAVLMGNEIVCTCGCGATVRAGQCAYRLVQHGMRPGAMTSPPLYATRECCEYVECIIPAEEHSETEFIHKCASVDGCEWESSYSVPATALGYHCPRCRKPCSIVIVERRRP